MNAVNLIPGDGRRRSAAGSTSRPTLALLAGLVVVLAAAVLYVSAVNNVTARKSELARVTASAASWRAAATGYASFMHAAEQRTQQLADIRQLAAQRFPWSQLLSQIGGVMPARAALISLSAATTTTSSTAAATSASAPPQPTVQLSGCAATQSTVAQTMLQLHRVSGVSDVTLSSSSDSSAGSTSGSSATSQGGTGSCPYPVQFQVALAFSAPASTAGGALSASTATGASGTPAASAGTSPSSATTAAAATPPTGAAVQ
jgi:Tfp pilus assembly protein PilN